MAKDVTRLTTIDEAAEQLGVSGADIRTACGELNIALVEKKADGTEGARKLRPDDLASVKKHLASKER